MTSRVMVSGGFDPLHIGHVRLLRDASIYGDVIVALNSDEWLKRKKGFAFMPFNERMEVIEAIGCVKSVIPVDDSDGTVCDAISKYRPDFFANGGDRGSDNTPEMQLCMEMGVKPLFNVGGGKVQSSSVLTGNRLVERPWGNYRVLYDNDFKVKVLTVNPGQSTSVQRHKYRNEHWVYVDTNDYDFIMKDEIHQLSNKSDRPIKIVEIQTGEYFGEDDIERFPAGS